MAVGVARDHQAELQARGLRCQCCQQRPPLKAGANQIGLDRREVVEEPDVLKGGRPVSLQSDLQQRIVSRMLWRRLDPPS